MSEEIIIKYLLEFIKNYPVLLFIVLSLFSLISFWIMAPSKPEIENIRVFGKQFSGLIMFTFLSVFIIFFNFEEIEKYKSYVMIFLMISGSALSFYTIYKLIDIKGVMKNKDKNKIVANRVVLHSYTKDIDKIAIRNNLREEPKIPKHLLTKDMISKIKKAKYIKQEIKDKINSNINLGKIIINNLGIQTDFKIDKFKKIKTDEIKNTIKKIKVNQLSKIHLSVVEIIKNGYAMKYFNDDVERIDKKYKNLKLPISKYRLEMELMSDYEKSTALYIVPITNLTLLSENDLDDEFLGGLQNIVTSSLKSVGYSYFKIYEEYKEELNKKKKEELNNKRILELKKSSSSQTA